MKIVKSIRRLRAEFAETKRYLALATMVLGAKILGYLDTEPDDMPDEDSQLSLRIALERCKDEIGTDTTWDDENVVVRAGDLRVLVAAIESGWLPTISAPRGKVCEGRVLVQLYGNDRWSAEMRVVPGYFEDDGRAIAMDEGGHYPFNARCWKRLDVYPCRGS